MLRKLFFKPHKTLPLGRWTTQTTANEIDRRADLANYDSCGTCGVPENREKTSTFMVQDDIVDIGDLVYVGSYHINKPIETKLKSREDLKF